MIKAFLFDLDGVLTDTSEFHYRAWQHLADDEGLAFSRADNEELRGISRRESLNILLKGKKISEELANAWMERKNSYYGKLVEQMTPDDLLPGAKDLLVGLRAAGIKIAIASSSKNAPKVIDRLKIGSFIDAMADGNIVKRSKPAPDIFLKASELLGVSPANCVIVEDAAAGIEAGIAAGMHTLGIGPVERVSLAEYVLPNLVGVEAGWILQLFSSNDE